MIYVGQEKDSYLMIHVGHQVQEKDSYLMIHVGHQVQG
jgi:hypothetical protein